MELRRAILLFAVVLGLAAIVSSIARPPDRGEDRPATDASRATTGPSAAADPVARPPQPATIEFRSGAKPQTRKVEQGQAATVLVDVETAGQIEIPSLGLIEAAEPLTPAIFEVLETTPGSHPILVQPAASETPPKKVGTLRVVPAS